MSLERRETNGEDASLTSSRSTRDQDQRPRPRVRSPKEHHRSSPPTQVKTIALWVAVLALLVPCLFRLAQVTLVERGNTAVGIALDWHVIDALADSPAERIDLLQSLEEAGLTNVLLRLDTVGEFVAQGRLTPRTRRQMKGTHLGREVLSAVPPTASHFLLVEDDVAQAVRVALRERYGAQAVGTTTMNGVDVVYGAWDAYYLGTVVSVDSAALATISESSLGALLSHPGGIGAGREQLQDLLTDAIDSAAVDGVYFAGSSPFQFNPEENAAFREFLGDKDLYLVMRDLDPQQGIEAYARSSGWRAVRSHALPTGTNPGSTVLERARRAVRERNVRLLRLLPDGGATTRELVESTAAIRDALSPPFSLGAPTTFAPLGSQWLPSIAAIGLASLVHALLLRVSGLWRYWAAAAIFVTGMAALALQSFSQLPMQAWMLAVSVSIAVLAVTALNPATSAIAIAGQYTRAVMITLTGAVVIATLGTTNAGILGLLPFRGVKVLLAAPLVFVAIIAVRHTSSPLLELYLFGRRRPWNIALVIVGGIAAIGYYLVRSGNSGLVWSLEMQARDTLDALLPARPRFKEFLIGFPLLLVSVWARARTNWGWWAAAAGTIATAGVLNSFAHFHAPLSLSLTRTALSVAIGGLIGALVVALLSLRHRPTAGETRRR